MTGLVDAPVPTPDLTYVIEAGVALAIALMFVLFATFAFKSEHRAGEGGQVLLGALVYGLIAGLLVGFVLMPVRIALMSGEMPANHAAAAGVASLALVVALRGGAIGLLPVVGGPVRAFRRAGLRRTIARAQKQLSKLEIAPVAAAKAPAGANTEEAIA